MRESGRGARRVEAAGSSPGRTRGAAKPWQFQYV